jgi:hypothetical protein
VPDWLQLYSESDAACDRLLDFRRFRLSQLKDFDRQLLKLYKQVFVFQLINNCWKKLIKILPQAVINTVVKFEDVRREINQELARRAQGNNANG